MSESLQQIVLAPEMPSPEEVLEGLNEAQKAAVTHLGGPLLIVAGAGSGKTRTLTRRFEWLVANGADPERILALTYTKDAANEMAERIEALLGDLHEEIHATTFHSLGMEILRDEAAAAGLNPFFKTATSGNRVAIMLGRLGELSFDRIAVRGNPAAVLGELVEMIDRLKEECVSPEDLSSYAEAALADAASPEDRDKAELLAERALLYAQHDQFLKEAAWLDFGGMQFELYKLLSRNPEVRARVARRFDHVLVDEFQDTSHVQLEILKLLVADHGNLAAVGDDDQSIYRFRGATPRSILDFEQRFGPSTRIELDLNYRSAPPIVDAARAVITAIPEDRRVAKDLKAAEDKPGGVLFWHAESEVAEAQAIVAEIERLIAEENVEPRQICVLTSKRNHADVLADRLAAHDIPFSRDTRDFFRRSEIRIPLSWLKLLANPKLNEEAWRLLTAHPVNFDSADYADLMRWMSRGKHRSVLAALRSAVHSKTFLPETLDKMRHFLASFDELDSRFGELTPGEFTIRLINEISIKGSLVLEGGADAPGRLANLAKLQRMAEEYEAGSPQANAREFANYMTATVEAGFEEVSESPEIDPNVVQLKTAHGSKGLEFEYVFLPGMDAGRWPGRRRGGESVPEALLNNPMPPLPGKNPKREEHIEETRRLAHVAMTRARRQLVLSWFDSDARGHKVSPFYSEAMVAIGGEEELLPERDFDPAEFVHAEIEVLREQLMGSVAEAGRHLGEMRLDAHAGTPLDFARFAELLKLSALTERLRHGQTISDALPEINAMLGVQMSAPQRAAYEASELDARLTKSEQRVERVGSVIKSLTPQLSNFLPTIRGRLSLSASSIGRYEHCPKQFEYEKVLKVPMPDQSHLRLGSTVHIVLERFHRELDRPLEPAATRERLVGLLDQAVVGGGWGTTDDDRQLLERAKAMLERYAQSDIARPDGEVRVEVPFNFDLDPTPLMHETKVGGKFLKGIHIRGKIDRIDTLADGTHRVLDYKTGHDKRTERDLRNYVESETQLAIYKLAGSRALGIDADMLTYFFLERDNPVVEAEASDGHVAEVRAKIDDVADRIISLDFPPAPDFMKCGSCPFRQVCPATEV